MKNNESTDLNQLTEGPVAKTLITKTIPMVFAMLAMISFSLIDAFFVGQLGTKYLAALSFTFPIVFFISGISLGLGTGVSALVSKAIGSGDSSLVKRLTSDSLSLALIIVTIFIVIGIITFEPLFRSLGATDETLPLIREYMYFWYPGMLCVVIPMVGNSATRATGDTKTPSLIMIFAVVLNVILDPLLIFGWGPFPRLEIAGAAISSVTSRFITLLLSIWILAFRDKMLSLRVPKAKEVWRSWKDLLYVGLPAAGTNVIVPLGAGIITGLLAKYGKEAVAAFGVATRIDALALSAMMALGSVLGPFIGQNYGAKKLQRMNDGIKISGRIAIFWGLGMAIILALFASPVASLFDKNPKVIELISLYLLIIPVSYGIVGILMVSGVSFNVLNKPLNSAIISLFRTFALLIPLAYLGSNLFGLVGIYVAGLASNIIAGIIAWIWLKSHLKSINQINGIIALFLSIAALDLGHFISQYSLVKLLFSSLLV